MRTYEDYVQAQADTTGDFDVVEWVWECLKELERTVKPFAAPQPVQFPPDVEEAIRVLLASLRGSRRSFTPAQCEAYRTLKRALGIKEGEAI